MLVVRAVTVLGVVLLHNVARPTSVAQKPVKINIVTGIDIRKQHLEQGCFVFF